MKPWGIASDMDREIWAFWIMGVGLLQPQDRNLLPEGANPCRDFLKGHTEAAFPKPYPPPEGRGGTP